MCFISEQATEFNQGIPSHTFVWCEDRYVVGVCYIVLYRTVLYDMRHARSCNTGAMKSAFRVDEYELFVNRPAVT